GLAGVVADLLVLLQQLLAFLLVLDARRQQGGLGEGPPFALLDGVGQGPVVGGHREFLAGDVLQFLQRGDGPGGRGGERIGLLLGGRQRRREQGNADQGHLRAERGTDSHSESPGERRCCQRR